MSRTLPAFIVISLAGCGSAHLGPRFAGRYRAAFEAQVEARREQPEPAGLDAADAKLVLARHRASEQKGGGRPSGVTLLQVDSGQEPSR